MDFFRTVEDLEDRKVCKQEESKLLFGPVTNKQMYLGITRKVILSELLGSPGTFCLRQIGHRSLFRCELSPDIRAAPQMGVLKQSQER